MTGPRSAHLGTSRLDIADQKRAYNRRLFSIVAPRYATATQILSLGNDSVWKKKLVAHLPAAVSPRICDLACGPGDISFLLQSRYPKGTVCGFDLSADMLAARCAKAGKQTFLKCSADMQQLPVADSGFDIVTGGYALRNAPDIHAAVHEIARILKPGGTAAFLDFCRADSRVIAACHNAVLWCWGSLIGAVLHGDYNVYAYLARSLKLFPRRSNLRELFARHGLKQRKSKGYFGGIIEFFFCRTHH